MTNEEFSRCYGNLSDLCEKLNEKKIKNKIFLCLNLLIQKLVGLNPK